MGHTSKVWMIRFGDFLFACLLFGPFTVVYWRGTWLVMDVYLLPGDPQASGWVSFSVASALIPVFYFSQERLEKTFDGKNPIVFIFVYHIYTYLFGFLVVNQWRGLWVLLDHYTGKLWTSALVTLCLGVFVLVVFRSLGNTLCPPTVTSVDVDPAFFRCTTRFRTQMSDMENYFWDVLFTVCVVGSFIVVAWRGLWTLFDNFVFPESHQKSALACLVSGYILVVVAYVLQKPLSLAFRQLKGKPLTLRTLLHDLLLLLAFVGSVALWRGVWSLCDLYVWPGHKDWSAWVTHGVGIAVMMVSLAGNSVLVRGCSLDGQPMRDNDGVYLSTSYISIVTKSLKQPLKKNRYDMETRENGVERF